MKHLEKYYDESFNNKYNKSMTDLYVLVGVTTFAFLAIFVISVK